MCWSINLLVGLQSSYQVFGWDGSWTWYQGISDWKVSGLNLNSTRIDLLRKIKGTFAVSTLQTQRALAWEGVLEYKFIPEPSTISLNLWLRWHLNGMYKAQKNPNSNKKWDSLI